MNLVPMRCECGQEVMVSEQAVKVTCHRCVNKPIGFVAASKVPKTELEPVKHDDRLAKD